MIVEIVWKVCIAETLVFARICLMNMSMILKIRARGTITIPKEIRKSLKLKEGGYLEVSLKDEKIIIKPIEIIDKELQKKILNYFNK